jgi:hypothetical protein
MGTVGTHMFARSPVLGKVLHSDLAASNCHLRNRGHSRDITGAETKGWYGPTAVSAIQRAEDIDFSDFCGYGPPRALAFETISDNPAGPGGLDAVLPCYCKSDLLSQIPLGAFLRLCDGHGMGRDRAI